MITFRTHMAGPEVEIGAATVNVLRSVEGNDGETRPEWCVIEVSARSKTGVIHRLARDLAAAGVADQPWRSLFNDRPSLQGPSIYAIAKTKVRETDQGIFVAGWETRPDGLSRCDCCDSDRFMHHGCCIRCLPVQNGETEARGGTPQRPSGGSGQAHPHPPTPPA